MGGGCVHQKIINGLGCGQNTKDHYTTVWMGVGTTTKYHYYQLVGWGVGTTRKTITTIIWMGWGVGKTQKTITI